MEPTIEVREPPTLPPCADSGCERAIGVTGKDDVLLIRGVNSFVRDNDLEMEGFSLAPVDDPSEARLEAFSISEELRYLKLSFGKRAFIDDLPLAEEGPGDPLTLASMEPGVKRKFTFLGVGLGVGGIFIATKSSAQSSDVLEGISR